MADPTGYRWNESAARYVDTRGRFVSRSAVRAALDGAIENSGRTMRDMTQRLRDGAISLQDWQLGMAREIKAAHLASGAAAKGGFAQLTQADYGRIGRIIRDEYSFLRNRAAAIASGEQRLDGTILRISEMYVEASRHTYHEIERREMAIRGYDEERNVRHAADSCDGCLAAEDAGWVEIGSLPAVGTRDCLSRCKCEIIYRNSALGEAA